jgi:exonuclease SbcC
MKIKKVTFKNFCSYGNIPQVLTFDDSQSHLYLVMGSNGAGKSTIANAIKFLLYGKVDGMSNTDLPNRINKEMYGEIEIETKGKLVKIVRGLSPNIFKVYINGDEYDRAGKVNTQDYLEEELFEIPYQVFKNVIILSVNDFKSFLTMSPADKKNIVDKIFGFSLINDMRELVKVERKEIKTSIKTVEDEIASITESISTINERLESLETKEKEKNKEKVDELKTKAKDLDVERQSLSTTKDTLSKKLSQLDTDIESKVQLLNLDMSEIRDIDKKLDLYENQKCPMCESDLTTDYHVHHKHELDVKKTTLVDRAKTIKQDILDVKAKVEKAKSAEVQLIQKISGLESSINSLKQELINLVKNVNGSEFEELKNLVRDFEKKNSAKDLQKNRIENDDYFLSLLEDALGEGGIKNLAMKTILPALNNHIAVMSKKMNIHFNIKFDDKFDSYITHLGEEISPRTLSTGERKKADFVIIISLIKLLKLRFPGLNILFLDEIFSSVDHSGVYHIIEILSDVIKEIKLNTFVINHTVLPNELFDRRIEIRKESGFSEFEVEIID